MSYNPTCVKAIMRLGILEARMENWEGSLKLLFKAKTLAPNDYRVYFNIASVYLKDQNFKSAVEYFKLALKLDKNNLQILTPYIVSLSKLEQWKDLEETCKLILTQEKTNPLALALLTRSMKENENFKDLENVLTKMNKKLENFEKKSKEYTKQEISKTVHKLKKKLRIKLKEIKNRNKIFNQALHNPESGGIDNSKNQNSIQSLEQGLRLKTNMSELKSTRKGDNPMFGLSEDPKELLEVIKNDKNNRDALFNLAMLYYKRQEYKSAEEYLLKINEVDPNFKSRIVKEKLGDIQLKTYKNSKLALKYYEESNALDTNAILLVKIGRCYEKLNDLNAASREYLKCIEINPNFLWGIFHLGLVNSKLGKEPEALSNLKRAFELDKDNTDVISKYSEELIKSTSSEDIDYAIEILKKALTNYVGNVDIMFCLARAYERRENFKEGISILEEANTYNDFYSNPNKLFLLALLYEKDKNFNKATQVYKNVLSINKGHIQSLVHLGFMLHNAREYKRAHKYFKFALKIDPNLAYAHFGIGRIYQTMKNYDEALDHFMQCSGNDKNNYKAYFHMGIIYLDTENFIKSKEMFEKCLEIKSDYVLGIVGMGDVYYEKGDYINAEKYHLRAYEMPNVNSLQPIVSYANTLAALQKYDESISLYLQALKIDSEIADVHYFLGNIYYIVDNFDDAITHYVKSIKIDKGTKPEVYYNLGNALCSRFRYKEAVKCYKMSLKFEPNNLEVFYNLGNAYHVLGSHRKAINNYEECIKRNFMSGEVKFSLIRAYFSIAGFDAFKKCEEILKSLITEDPNNTKVLIYQALIKEKMNHTEEAIVIYKRIIEIDPNNMEAKLNLQSLEEL